MSVVYAYGFVRASAELAPIGLDGAPVERIGRGDIALLGSRLASEDAADPWEGIVAHNRVLCDAVEHGPVVPLRAGALMSPDHCEQLLAREQDRVARQLDRFAGRIEARVRFSYREEALMREIVAERPGLARSGPGYHQRLRAGEEIVNRLQAKRAREKPRLSGSLAACSEAVVEHDEGELTVLDASFLVADDALADFEGALGQLEQAHGARMEMKYVAPLPFYSFADDP